ncbi:MAG: hypothetical protein H6P99_347 [Holophagaceae bacterium]|nr:hypothetical protein [Holophagaceae bacterium]
MDWIALKHALLSHLPVASGLLLPWALIAAQRPGRGIRPWWTVSRYLGWTGLLGTLGAVVSGFASGRLLNLIPDHRLLPLPASGHGPDAVLFRHALLGGASLLLAIAALWAMNRPRKDHQGLGFLTLVVGLAWSALLLLAGEGGYRLAHANRVPLPPPVAVPASPAQTAPPVAADPEANAPLRALDHAALEPIHSEPVKSPAHGGRWIRAWASPTAAAAYRAGQPLPQGALVVLSSTEDRWGRPGADVGPLYALEMKPLGPSLTFYWARIPMEQRREFGGESRAYWRGDDAHLASCRSCHANGMADPAQRSRWRAKKAVPAE